MENPGECDIDDLLCQVRVQGHLQGIRGLLGDEKFREQFPEFQGLEETLTEKITAQETTLRESFERCGIPLPEQFTTQEAPATQADEGSE